MISLIFERELLTLGLIDGDEKWINSPDHIEDNPIFRNHSTEIYAAHVYLCPEGSETSKRRMIPLIRVHNWGRPVLVIIQLHDNEQCLE